MISLEEMFLHLKSVEPNEGGPNKNLPLFTLSGDEYHLHVDVNDQDGKYGYMWEWWLENEAGYVDGGFEPANNDEDLRKLASLIHAAGVKVESSAI